MTDLGDLGVVREPEEITFGYFGARLRTNPNLTDVGVMRMVRRLLAVDEKNVLAAMESFEGIVADLVHPDDLGQFWALSEQNRQRLEDIGDTIEQIMEGVTERPTVRPSDSSDGSSRTVPSSGGDSSSAVIHRLEARGRPDLAQFVAQAQEASA